MRTRNDDSLNSRSKIVVRWTTNPADMGYDGKKSRWLELPGETMGIKRAANFGWELSQKIGTGVYRLIDYRYRGERIDIDDILMVAAEMSSR